MSHRISKLTFVIAVIVLTGLSATFAPLSPGLSASAAPPAQGDAQRGAYVFALNGGCGCHMGAAGFLAGGEKFEGPFGVLYATNITPDSDTGIGKWTDQQVIDAIRLGKRPDGSQLFPIMPYPYFSGLADQDVQDLVAFLRTAPPVKNAVPARQLNFPVPPFTPRAPAPALAPTEGVARGAYLVNTISHCGACHTPQNPDGSPDMSRFLAGGFDPALGVVPNITPDEETGIGKWTEAQIAALLRTGTEPDGSQVGGVMAQVVEGGLKDMTEADAGAIAAYLKTVPAVKNVPQAPSVMPTTGGDLSGGIALAGLVALLSGGVMLVSATLRRWRHHRV